MMKAGPLGPAFAFGKGRKALDRSYDTLYQRPQIEVTMSVETLLPPASPQRDASRGAGVRSDAGAAAHPVAHPLGPSAGKGEGRRRRAVVIPPSLLRMSLGARLLLAAALLAPLWVAVALVLGFSAGE